MDRKLQDCGTEHHRVKSPLKTIYLRYIDRGLSVLTTHSQSRPSQRECDILHTRHLSLIDVESLRLHTSDRDISLYGNLNEPNGIGTRHLASETSY